MTCSVVFCQTLLLIFHSVYKLASWLNWREGERRCVSSTVHTPMQYLMLPWIGSGSLLPRKVIENGLILYFHDEVGQLELSTLVLLCQSCHSSLD